MKKPLAVLTIALALPAIAAAQGNSHGRGNSDHHKQGASAQSRREDEDRQQRSEAMDRRQRIGNAWVPPRPSMWRPTHEDRERSQGRWYGAPRVERASNRWVVPVYRREDFYLPRYYDHGRFIRGTGPQFVWQLRGGTRTRFNVSGVYFSLLYADYPYADGWDWYGDYIVIYDDPEHYGWYLAYNVRLGMYLHVRYMGYY
jgi:hypothetical protein